MKGRVNQHNLPIKNSYNKKKRDLICIQTNAEKNVRLRVASSTDNQPDASAEAIMRHEMKKFYPKLQLQTQSITNDNYKTVKSRFNITKHPATEPMIPDRPICTNK
jgi:translation elongation factor EF-Ts